MTRRNVLIALAIVLVGAAVVGANFYFKKDTGLAVTTETIKTRDLEAIVSASGKIQPNRVVNISSDTSGRVVNLAVDEGYRVSKGQFLMQIDPVSLQKRVDNEVASVAANEQSLQQLQQSIETGRVQFERTQQLLQRQQDLWKRQVTTRDALDQAQNDVDSAKSALLERQRLADAQKARIEQERSNLDSAKYDLSKVRIQSPIDGIVTKRNINEGETAVIGTMNNAGTVLLTLADMSLIQAEVEVDETSMPSVTVGQKAKVSIDAIPDKTFNGHVTEVGNSPLQTQTPGQTGTQATTFKVVVVLDDTVPEMRPGFTCTADITTATRGSVTSVPIPAVAVRELVFDANGQIVKEPHDQRGASRSVEPVASAAELKPGQTRKETEGVFVVRSEKAEFVPIKMGIAGDKYFEVVDGLKSGDQVITGPYNSVRNLADGSAVKIDNKAPGAQNK
jgi:HlyD family secretion protein